MQENKFRQKKQKKRYYFIHIVNIFTSLCSWHYLNHEAFTNKAANLIVVISIQSNETEVTYYHGHKWRLNTVSQRTLWPYVVTVELLWVSTIPYGSTLLGMKPDFCIPMVDSISTRLFFQALSSCQVVQNSALKL